MRAHGFCDQQFRSPALRTAHVAQTLACQTCNRHALGDDFVGCDAGDGTVLHLASLFMEDLPLPPVISFAMGTLGFLTPFNASMVRSRYPPPASRSAATTHTGACAGSPRPQACGGAHQLWVSACHACLDRHAPQQPPLSQAGPHPPHPLRLRPSLPPKAPRGKATCCQENQASLSARRLQLIVTELGGKGV